MKAIQAKGVANERVITRQQKRIKYMIDGQEHTEAPLYTLNQEVKKLKEKLEEEGRQPEKRSRSQGDGGEGVGNFVGPNGDGQGQRCKRVQGFTGIH